MIIPMVDRNANPRARVFISCGQQPDEATIAREIGLRLEALGYDPYIAVREQTLRGLKENIFDQLSKSEYFVFVDFKREELDRKTPPEYRGSLFSHQELAIASYLNLDTLVFQENGVRKLDGVVGFLQANAIPFTDRHTLPNVIADKVQERPWNPKWRNDLFLDRVPNEYFDVYVQNVHRHGRFFVIDVHNRHQSKIASNCYAYLEKATKVDTNEEIQFRTCELKWSGYVLPNAHILPGGVRGFDAFWVPHDAPDQLVFQVFTDSGLHVPNIRGKGTYELRYMVIADGFPVARCVATLDLDGMTLPTALTVK